MTSPPRMYAVQEHATSRTPLNDTVCLSDPSTWRYVAEGAANLVVAYNPEADRTGRKPELEHKALRLKKRATTQNHAEDSGNIVRSDIAAGWIGMTTRDEKDEGATKSSTMDNYNAFADFNTRILARLFKPDNLLGFQSVRLEASWLQALGSFIHPSRPKVQSARSEVDTISSSGLLMDDLTSRFSKSGEAFHTAFEIKPKWTFLPRSIDNLKPEHRQIKSSYCRTCIYRAVRSVPIEDGIVSTNENLNAYYTSKTRFCPLMLFGSSDLRNVRDGVDRLHREWLSANPGSSGVSSDHRPSQAHNNFRVFANGAAVSPEQLKLEEQTLDLLAQGIHQSSALKRLDELQRRLDPIDLDGISSLLANEPNNAQLDQSIELSEIEALIPLLTSSTTPNEYDIAFQKLSVREKVVMYMLSMTMKDCSVFVRLPQTAPKPVNDGSSAVLQGVDIKLIDLDLKPISRLRKYIARDAEVLSRFKKLLDSVVQPVPCLDLGL